VSAGPNPKIDTAAIEKERQRLGRMLDEVSRLCESNAPPQVFFEETLNRLMKSLAALAGAVWTRTAQGNLVLQFHSNLRSVGLDQSEEARQAHEELLRHAVTQPRPFHLMPRSGFGPQGTGKVGPGNYTEHILLMVPITQNGQVIGLLEVWQEAKRPQSAIPGFLQFMGLIADMCARYQRNQMMGQLAGQQQLWTQLEAFARQIHGSLNTTEVSYMIANEGARLIEADRVSIAVREVSKVRIEAVSGADTVERRSKEVRLMRALCEHVIDWGERLIFRGVPDDSLPPKVLESLDAYLIERPSKLLVIEPLVDDRQKPDKEKAPASKPPEPRSALFMECFEPSDDPQQLIARMEVVAKHATSALYNAVEYRRIPMRWIWLPLARVQEGLGGKARAISALVVLAVSILFSVLVFLPYELKMEADGKLLPEVRVQTYAPATGIVQDFDVGPGDSFPPGKVLAYLHDPELVNQLKTLDMEHHQAVLQAAHFKSQAGNSRLPQKDRTDYLIRAAAKESEANSKLGQLNALVNRTGFIPRGPKAGFFTLRAPDFSDEDKALVTRPEWTILDSKFKEEWRGRLATPADPILHLGAKNGPWGLMLEIPHKNVGQILDAMHRLRAEGKEDPVLDVEFLLRTKSTEQFTGRLKYSQIAGKATPSRNENDEPAPVVLAWVTIDDKDIPEDYRLPENLLLSGAQVKAKVCCGQHRLGYALFHGVWEFFYEKVVFFF
jgi:hypothetical protein